jgi:hypothetical protein
MRVFWCQDSPLMKVIFRVLLVAITFTVSFFAQAKNIGDVKRLHVESLGALTLEKPLEAGRPSHISAASGIVELNGKFYVNADDETALFSWKMGDKTATPFILDKKELGADPVARKRIKPDYESLLHLDEKNWPPYGALLAWPSASTDQRYEASIATFNKNGNLEGVTKVNIQNLAKTLGREVKKLNLEGITLNSGKIYLFNRGNGKEKGLKSGYFEMAFADFLKGLKGEGWPSSVTFQKVKIGKLKGVKLTLADGLWTKFGFIGLAPAEDSDTVVADGKVTGTVLVRINGKKGEVIGQFDLDKKFEGFLTREKDEGLEILLVDDADDPKIPSGIYRAQLTKKDLDSL